MGVFEALCAPSTAIERSVAAFACVTVVVKSLSQCGRNSNVGASAADGCACSAVSTCTDLASINGQNGLLSWPTPLMWLGERTGQKGGRQACRTRCIAVSRVVLAAHLDLQHLKSGDVDLREDGVVCQWRALKTRQQRLQCQS